MRIVDIKDFERYTINDSIIAEESVWDKKQEKWMTPYLKEKGHTEYCLLGDDNKWHPVQFHRALAIAFIPNPLGLSDVHHIIPLSKGGTNELSNLMWISHSDHMRLHSLMSDFGGKNKPKLEEHKRKISEALKGKVPIAAVKAHAETHSMPVAQYDLNDNLINVFPSMREASRINKYDFSAIKNCCDGGFFRKGKWINCNTYKNYKWKSISKEQYDEYIATLPS